MRFKYIEGQLSRWLEELSQFDMTIMHRPWVKHTNADSLSRIPSDIPFCNCFKAGCDVRELQCGGCKFYIRAHEEWERFADEVDDIVPLSMVDTRG